MEFETVIGLEVHVQLNTKSKMFCSCATSFGDAPNTHTCPVCLALPGALPVPNREAFVKAAKLGNAIKATVHKRSVFDRKNYFYPDLPKGYQISQFTHPIVENGYLMIDYDDGTQKRVGITRAHLEEDAGKNIHSGAYSLVDLNRAGTPLLEIVSEPDMRSADEATRFLKKLHAIARYLGISDANMQEGSFRCDANVSIRPKGDPKLYPRVEIKNLNSFKFIQKAIDYEVARQIEAWEDGDYANKVWQETRLYDSAKNETRSMRGKEESADYRYFPDPDLLPVSLDEATLEEAKKLPELPDEKRKRYVEAFGLSAYDAGVITGDLVLVGFFEALMEHNLAPKNAVSWLTTELLGRLNKSQKTIENSPVSPQTLAKLIERIEDSTISAKAGKEALDYLFENGGEVDTAIERLGLKQVSDDSAIESALDSVLSANAANVERYKNGETKLFGFFVGQIMKESGGKANPAKVNEALRKRIG
ncbi:MAG: Asp-tRNA(Asn)/Glu-tRNA(Gln) amidotransferase subunit GatB [Helicobacteraceae bacterium]|jgi:aspartyl-tRNA(Asn)/glutamyl-tRNA(Gln) amidotransferase subunit B|nr:Asp-tRNA(Asn)/Glu-tRNA(Gln) amidotransferase subunit GatB [Helicobacteraceae bacterium]